MRIIYIILFSVVLTGTGCALYPTSRTYFEPNQSDGELAPSMGCGYHAAKHDSLIRKLGEVTINVTPYYKEGEELQVIVLFQEREDSVVVNPEHIEVKSSSAQNPIPPSTIKQANQPPRSNWPYYMKWNYLTYPLLSESLDEISVIFNHESVLVNNEEITLKKFRFKKTTKSDIYYASINC